MFKCKQQDMSDYRNKIFTEVYAKLEELETAPQLLKILVNSMQGEPLERTQETNEMTKLIYRFKIIGQFNLLNGFIPLDLCDIQQRFYKEQGSNRQGKTWGVKLVSLLLDATVSIWNKRNLMEHNRVAHGLSEVENIRLKLEVENN